MQLTTAVLTSLLATVSLAAPSTRRDGVTSMAATETWTFTGLKRTCDFPADNSCKWEFKVNTTPCSLTTVRAGSQPASQALAGGPATCGVYTVTSGWSGQFGPGNGFTTLAVANQGARLIAYPAYRDVELPNGQVIGDRSYPTYQI